MYFFSPHLFAYATRAASVGSPATVSSELRTASQQSAIAVARSGISSVFSRTTVILFCVRVPVLSEHITCAQPRASTAVSLRMIAPRFDILVTPMESTTVTTAASPSGIAATARLTAIMNELRKPGRVIAPSFTSICKTFIPRMMIHITSTAIESILLSWSRLFWRGVSSSSAFAIAPAILPISVSMPVATTTASARP